MKGVGGGKWGKHLGEVPGCKGGLEGVCEELMPHDYQDDYHDYPDNYHRDYHNAYRDYYHEA